MPNFVSGAMDSAQAREFLSRADAHLEIAFQPIFGLQTGALYGVEALTRGAQALGFENPMALFDVADQLGVLAELEARQMEAAVRKIADLNTPSTPHLFINLDTRLLLSSMSIIERLEAALQRVERPRRLVTVELSERHDKSQETIVADRIREIRKRGFMLALDDFGVGVSDMRSLHDFDIDVMKIDRFFIDGLARDRRKRFLVGRMIELAHLLGQNVLCEGVECAEDLRVCQELGSDLAQGYFLGRPEIEPTRVRIDPVRAEERRDAGPRATDAALAEALQNIKPLSLRAPLSEAVVRFRSLDHPPHCPVVGDHGEPVGVICEGELRRFAYSPFGLDLLNNPSEPVRVSDFLRRYPLATIDTDPIRLAALLADTDCDGIVITNGGLYEGFLPAAALVRLAHAENLAAAQDANPLTRLPGNRVISDFLESACADEGERAFCYFDFDNFKPFNDVYGFQTGDRAIAMFSEILKSTFQAEGTAVCHIGGDDFFVGAFAEPGRDLRDRFTESVIAARRRFGLNAESLFTPQDRAAGGVMATDRAGVACFFPLLSCSAGVIFAEAGAQFSRDEFAVEIADVKKRAKAAKEGLALTELGVGRRVVSELASAAPAAERRPELPLSAAC